MSHLRLVFEPPVARIILDRPERRNAISAEMWKALGAACFIIAERPDVAAVLVEGAGGHFSAGADISEFDSVFSDIESAKGYLGAIEEALTALSELDRPTLAILQGSAIGGGLAVALACDLRFAADDVHLATPPAKLGLLYGPVETRLLVETIGSSAAKDLLYSARRVPALEALQIKLVNRVLPASALASESLSEVLGWARLSSASIRGAKKVVRATLALDRDASRKLVEDAAMGEDFAEGRAAYNAKRTPAFGRGG